MTEAEPFWKRKSLAELDDAEWESLCDGCGNCCLHVFEDEDGGGFLQVPVACRLLDTSSCRCTDYAHRKTRVPSCIVLTPSTVLDYPWLPDTCAYRRVALGRDLPPWHHLVCGDPDRVHTDGPSVRDRAVSEREADPFDALAALLDERDDDGSTDR